MIKIHFTPVGFIREEDGVLEVIKLGEDTDSIGRNLYKLYRGRYSLNRLLRRVRSEEEVVTTSRLLYKMLIKVEEMRNRVRYEEEYRNIELLIKANVVSNRAEAVDLLKNIMKKFTEERLREELMNKDLLLIHAINSYDEYNEVINLFYERLREWYGIYFPELDDMVSKIDSYVNLVSTLGRRDDFKTDRLLEMGYEEEKARKIFRESVGSRGGMLEEYDIDIIMMHANAVKNLIKTRDNIEKYLEKTLSEIAPNITSLIGSKLAARLIAKAGGIRKLAMLPASTIQLLGAEKALFLALKKGGKPPKHGLIFQHPFISQSPKVIRGRVARLLAGKITIAARVDAFGGEFIGDKLYEEVSKKIDGLRRKAPTIKKRKKTVHRKKSMGRR